MTAGAARTLAAGAGAGAGTTAVGAGAGTAAARTLATTCEIMVAV